MRAYCHGEINQIIICVSMRALAVYCHRKFNAISRHLLHASIWESRKVETIDDERCKYGYFLIKLTDKKAAQETTILLQCSFIRIASDTVTDTQNKWSHINLWFSFSGWALLACAVQIKSVDLLLGWCWSSVSNKYCYYCMILLTLYI